MMYVPVSADFIPGYLGEGSYELLGVMTGSGGRTDIRYFLIATGIAEAGSRDL